MSVDVEYQQKIESLKQQLQDLLRDARELPVEQIPVLLIHLSACQAALATVLGTPASSRDGNEAPAEDRLLTPREAAALLGTSPKWLYRHHRRLPFSRQLSRKTLRFSQVGLQRWMSTRKKP